MLHAFSKNPVKVEKVWPTRIYNVLLFGMEGVGNRCGRPDGCRANTDAAPGRPDDASVSVF
jgi:hypothetical protein